MPPIHPSSPNSSGSHADIMEESEAVDTCNDQNVERHRDAAEVPQEDPENMEEPEHGGDVRNREVIDLISNDSDFDDVPLGELRAALRQADSGNIKKEKADNGENNPKDSSNTQEIIENDEDGSKPGAESHETGVSAHDEIDDAEERSDNDDRGTSETSTVIETEVASTSPMNEHEDQDDRLKLYPCPPGKRPTGKKWDGHRGVFVPKSMMDKKAKGVGRRVSSKLEENTDGLYPCPIGGRRPSGMRWDKRRGIFVPAKMSDKNKESQDTSPSSRKKNANALYPCPVGGPRPTGMRWDGHVGAFVPRSRFRSNSIASRDPNEDHDGSGEEDNEISESKDKSRPKKRTTHSRAENDTKRLKSHHSSASPAPKAAPRKPREPGTEIGSRIYACFPGNNLWYWGVIVDIKRKKNSHFDQYSVLFDDGDFVEYLSRNKYLTLFQYQEKPPSFPKTTATKLRQFLGSKADDILSSSPPNGRFLERAIGQNRTALARVLPEAFCQHIGAIRGPPAPSTSRKSSSRGKSSCGTCENCTRNACGKCARCKSGSTPCIQKMCLNVKPKWIAEPAVGFPEGYCFFFKKKDTDSFPRVMIMSRGGREFTFEGALSFCNLSDPDDVSRKFNEYIGFSARRSHHLRSKPALISKGAEVQGESEDCESDDDNDEFTHASPSQAHPRSPLESRESRSITNTEDFLIGRKYSFAWTDLKGQNKVVYGKVTECEIESQSEEVSLYKVEYNEKSRALANAVHNGCGSAVPEFQWLEPPMAIGGCVRHDEHTSTSADRLIETNLPFYTLWISPDARHEAVGNGLPQLTLAVRGYELTFTVKRSTIPNAGNGVFLSCSQMFDDDQTPFELRCGELVDIGSYAPLRIGDRRSEPVIYVKSFIHSATCEKFAFDQKGSTYQLDITDDVTGMLHTKAKRFIHAYVNESNEMDNLCIWAEHDAEDSVHYLLGHTNKAQGTFRLPCDGSEQEVFINYGPLYEKVRVRNGYSFLSEEEQADILEELRDEDMKDVLEMSIFSENEVEKATNFLFLLFTEEPRSKFTNPVMVERSLLCTAILQRRARQLSVTCQDSLTSVCKMLRKLVFILLGILNDEPDELHKLQAGGHFDKLLNKILERQYSEEQLSKFGFSL